MDSNTLLIQKKIVLSQNPGEGCDLLSTHGIVAS